MTQINKIPDQMLSDDGLGYTEEALVFFEGLILKKLEEARSDFQEFLNLHGNPNATDDTDSSLRYYKEPEDPDVVEFLRLKKNFASLIKDCESALMRIRNKTYGICCRTGKPIIYPRLLAHPLATTCIFVSN